MREEPSVVFALWVRISQLNVTEPSRFVDDDRAVITVHYTTIICEDQAGGECEDVFRLLAAIGRDDMDEIGEHLARGRNVWADWLRSAPLQCGCLWLSCQEIDQWRQILGRWWTSSLVIAHVGRKDTTRREHP